MTVAVIKQHKQSKSKKYQSKKQHQDHHDHQLKQQEPRFNEHVLAEIKRKQKERQDKKQNHSRGKGLGKQNLSSKNSQPVFEEEVARIKIKKEKDDDLAVLLKRVNVIIEENKLYLQRYRDTKMQL